MSDKIIIFDTTLRDGEQSPGASMTRDEKLRIARQLERLRVDVIEAGFAASSNGDFEAVKAIAAAVKDSTVCSLARANDRDIARAAEALKGAASSRVHTFIATSPLHMEMKLRMTPEQVFEQARLAVRFARNLTGDVEFSPEDGYRSDPDFLCRVLEAVIAEGATTINIPDTVGYAIPELYGEFIRSLRERIPNADKAGVVGALPQRPRHGGGQFAGRREDRWRPADRVHDQRPGRARRQLRARRGGDGAEDAQGLLRVRASASTRRRSSMRRGWCRRPPASSCSRTRRSSAPTPSRMPRASIRTACSRRATPTRSCAPRTWAGRPTRSCSASSRDAMRSSSGCRNSASRSSPRPRSTPPSRASRSWPIARARSSRRTSSRW